MTDLISGTAVGPVSEKLRVSAQEDAEAAARAAGVQVREPPDVAGLDRLCGVFRGIWREEPDNPSITWVVVRALAFTGNYVQGAYAADGTLVGGCVGFFAVDGELHSHVAGVLPEASGRDVGFAVKMHQRAWALARNITRVSWTFDPLVRRNAYFNIVKLGALPRAYFVDYYGPMNDGINAGDETDRLVSEWRLDARRVAEAAARRTTEADVAALRAAGAAVALGRDDAGRPVAGTGDASGDAPVALVAVPRDVEALRAADPGAARAWRRAVRDVLGGLLAERARVTGFARDGWYVVERTAP
jgi:predicted GNAT superfamily acetyltransferase